MKTPKADIGEIINSWEIISIDISGKSIAYTCKCKCGAIRTKGYSHIIKTKQCTKCTAREKFDIQGQTINGYFIIKLDRITNQSSYWLCRCPNGHEKVRKVNHIKQNAQCRECFKLEKFNDLTGRQFGKWVVLETAGRNKFGALMWKCECQCVFKTNKIISAMHLIHEYTSKCQRCASGQYHEELSGFVWSRIKQSAVKRNLEFSITKEYVWDLYLKQNKKCAFTGLDLIFPTASGKYDGNLSLDRINSSLGYIEGNVQWVYKIVNIMKTNMPDQQFIKICKMVAEYRK